MCQKIVGTEGHVKTVRMMNSIRDNLSSQDDLTKITSGSFGEGLEIKGSDIDIMYVSKCAEVCESSYTRFNPAKTYFTMATEDTHPGFTHLRVVQCNDPSVFKLCEMNAGYLYFSSMRLKERILHMRTPLIHGPCMSDTNGEYDIAYCLHSKLWITQAKKWMTRSQNAWPGYDVKQSILRHGVLFVPIGVKGSIKEDLEWRISFSVGEKLLVFTFTHAQLLCYALLKILLKDVIDIDIDCKDLLCSYFLKTILFWISEEVSVAIWRPENLITNFMRCFRRLIYCVEYVVCPHYFIPDNNLFENKIKGNAQKILLNKLSVLNSYGWHCIAFSKQIPNFNKLAFHIRKEPVSLYVNSLKQLLFSKMIFADIQSSSCKFLLEKVLHIILSTKNSKIKHFYLYYISKTCCLHDTLQGFKDIIGNKSTYTQYNTCISSLLRNIRHNAVTGWLKLASFFYYTEQHIKATELLKYSLLKCSSEKLYPFMNLSHIHYDLFSSYLFRQMPVVIVFKYLLLDQVVFLANSLLIPEELRKVVKTTPCIIAPVVFAHILLFLCHYHLNNSRKCLISLQDLQLTIGEKYFIACSYQEAISYNIIGIAYQLVGDLPSARQAFKRSIRLYADQDENSAFWRLSSISGLYQS